MLNLYGYCCKLKITELTDRKCYNTKIKIFKARKNCGLNRIIIFVMYYEIIRNACVDNVPANS